MYDVDIWLLTSAYVQVEIRILGSQCTGWGSWGIKPADSVHLLDILPLPGLLHGRYFLSVLRPPIRSRPGYTTHSSLGSSLGNSSQTGY